MFFSSVPKKTGADLRRFNEKRSLTQAVGVGEKDGMAGRRSFKDLLRERKKKSSCGLGEIFASDPAVNWLGKICHSHYTLL